MLPHAIAEYPRGIDFQTLLAHVRQLRAWVLARLTPAYRTAQSHVAAVYHLGQESVAAHWLGSKFAVVSSTLDGLAPRARWTQLRDHVETNILPVLGIERGELWRVAHSLWAKLILLVIIFVGVPVALYGQFRDAEEQKQTILMNAVRDKGLVMGRSVEPILTRADETPFIELAQSLDNYASDQLHIKLLLKPAGAAGEESGFFYVAASPPVSTADLAAQQQRLVQQGVLGKLSASCAGDLPLAMRAALEDGREELLTSITPVRTERGCWALVISHSAESVAAMGLGKPYWQSSEVQLAAIIYLVMALLVIGLFLGLWRSLRHFGILARTVRERSASPISFTERNTIPELRDVALSFDDMIETLRSTAFGLRRAAEDNAHAFKTPLGIIRQAVEPLKRRIETDDKRGQSALSAIDASLEKLEGLVVSARRLDEATADSLDAPRDPVDLSALINKLVEGYLVTVHRKRVKLRADVEAGVVVRGGTELLEILLENILDNALSFSPEGGTVQLTLTHHGGRADLRVEDEGPGVPKDRLDHIFERYYSSRTESRLDSDEAYLAPEAEQTSHAHSHHGIGLWIVRRNVEAIGGRVVAENRSDGGLCIWVDLPVKQH